MELASAVGNATDGMETVMLLLLLSDPDRRSPTLSRFLPLTAAGEGALATFQAKQQSAGEWLREMMH